MLVQLRADVSELLESNDTPEAGLVARLDHLAEQLCARGHQATVRVSSAHYSPGTVHFSLKHVFIACKPPAGCDDSSQRIVDLAFREQFVIASPTAAYSRVLEALPEVFVGTPAALKSIADIMASEISTSFSLKKMPIPPWRRVHALYSKWFPSTNKSQGLFCQSRRQSSDFALPGPWTAQAV